MKILMISGAEFTASSGVTIHTLEMAGCLAEAGARVTLVLLGRTWGPGWKGVDVVALPVTRNKYLNGLLRPVLVCVTVLFLALKINYDLVYIRDSIYETPVVLLLRLLGRVVFLEVNTMVAGDLRAKGRAPWKLIVAGWAQRKACISATLVLPVTTTLAGWLAGQGVPAGRVAVVPNGANPYLYRPINRNSVLAELGLDPAKSYLCFAGSLAAWQGGNMIIESFSRLARYYPDTVLLVIGEGQDRNVLEAEVRRLGLPGRVIFTGRLPYHRVPVYMNACTVGIGGGWYGDNPLIERRFRFTGSSALKVYSYLACGLPVIIPDIPDLAGIVRRVSCGLVVEPDHVEDLEAALKVILNNPQHWAEAGAKGRVFIEREATWEHRAALIISLVDQVKRQAGELLQ